MTQADDERFLQIIRSISDFEVMFPLLRGLATARPNSQLVQEAFLEAVLVRGKQIGSFTAQGTYLHVLVWVANNTGTAQPLPAGAGIGKVVGSRPVLTLVA